MPHHQFWQQIPDFTRSDQQYSFDAARGQFHTGNSVTEAPNSLPMDTRVIKIGSTVSAKQQDAKKKAAGKNLIPPKRELVELWTDGGFVSRIPFSLLVRFSQFASEDFRRVDELAAEKARKEREALVCVSSGSGAVNQATTNKATARQATEAATTAIYDAPGTKPDDRRILELALLEVDGSFMPVYPTPFAIQKCVDWMNINAYNRGSATLIPFTVPKNITFHGILDIYTAVLSLDLRPFPREIYDQLMERLSENPHTIDDLKYIHERIPTSNRMVTRILTSMLKYKKLNRYTLSEWTEIQDYYSRFATLSKRFHEIAHKRVENREEREERSRRTREADASRNFYDHWEGLVKIGGQDKDGATRKVTRSERRRISKAARAQKTASPPVVPRTVLAAYQPGSKSAGHSDGGSVSEVSGIKSEPAIRTQLKEEAWTGNGKGVGGRHVPGA